MASSKSLIALVVVTTAVGLAAVVSAQNTAQDIVNLHNKARAAVGVGPVVWDPAIAQYAQAYASTRANDCLLQYSDGPYGENLLRAAAGQAWTVTDAVRWWESLKVYYHYDTNSCDFGKMDECTAYTNVVQRRTTRVGCGSVVCAGNVGTFIICNYDPPGKEGQRPYSALSY